MKNRSEKIQEIINIKIAQFLTQYRWVTNNYCYCVNEGKDDFSILHKNMNDCAMSNEFNLELLNFLKDLSELKHSFVFADDDSEIEDSISFYLENPRDESFDSIELAYVDEQVELFK